MTDIFDFWETVLARLGERISPEMLNWLMSHVLPLTLTEDTLTAQVSKPFLKIWLEQNLLSDLQATVNEVAARPLTLQITLPQATDVPTSPLPSTNSTETSTLPEPPVPIFTRPTPSVEQTTLPIATSTAATQDTQVAAVSENERNFGKRSIPIDPSCTFDNFIVSNSNTLARSAAFAVAQQPAQYQNPLFIYGPSGLGKTHFMHAICNYVSAHTPEKKFLFLTSEDFTNDFISALTQKGVEHNRAFREKYRSVDYLLIDDVQFFGKKDGTQLEFFHTFNELLNSKKQIVMTCDRLPENMEKVEQRLIWSSKFNRRTLKSAAPIYRKKRPRRTFRFRPKSYPFSQKILPKTFGNWGACLIASPHYSHCRRSRLPSSGPSSSWPISCPRNDALF